METLYIHEKTGNIQPMTEATVQILGGKKSGWRVATEEEVGKVTPVAEIKPNYLREREQKPEPETPKIQSLVDWKEPDGGGDDLGENQIGEQEQTPDTAAEAAKAQTPIEPPKAEVSGTHVPPKIQPVAAATVKPQTAEKKPEQKKAEVKNDGKKALTAAEAAKL